MKLSASCIGIPAGEKGFTLLEILIAIFILAIIMAIVLGPFTGIMASSREAERKIDLYQTARSVMDIISADISSACRG